MENMDPFQVGDVVLPENFINHQREIRRCVNNIRSGQSSAITGEPRSGKSSLLHFLKAEEKRLDLYPGQAANLLFAYQDALTFSTAITPANLWKMVLRPLAEQNSAILRRNYRNCENKNFTTTTLENLFSTLQVENKRLIVMIDEFDSVLCCPQLNQPEFYGALRTLSTRFLSLIVILASRQNVAYFNQATQAINTFGSPYFNFLQEIAVQPFQLEDALELIAHAEGLFDIDDKHWLWNVAGGHPYLLQAAASALWNTYQDGKCAPAERRQKAGKDFYLQAAPTLTDTWRLWSPELKKAFTIVGLDNLPSLLDPDRPRRFDIENMLQTLPEYAPELRQLEMRGFITSDSQLPGQWKVQAEVMLWWLAEALIHAMRQSNDLGRWLQAEGWDGLLKKGEKEALLRTIKTIGGLLPTSIDLLAKTAAAIKEIKG